MNQNGESFKEQLLFSTCAGWSAKTTLAGSVYYVNHLTKTTTWERPAP
ncbi:unnamed protein product, partial [Ectocarpus sp. 4 AP-2014]